MTVGSGSALMGGKTPTSAQTYTVVIDPDTALEEIVDVYNYSSGNTLSITRGRDGSTGVAHSAGAVVRHMIIGRDLQEANDHSENTTSAHGLTVANVVQTTDTGSVSTTMLAANAVTTAKITDANVTAAKLATDSVTTAKIVDSNVTTAKIADSAITSAKIADGTIVNADINSAAAIAYSKLNLTGSITSSDIVDGTIVNADINSAAAIDKTKISGTAITAGDTGTVTSTMIADGTIVNADVNASAGITYGKLSLTGGIVNTDISNSAAISLGKLATDPLARANHTGTQTASTISDFDTQVRTSRLDQMAAPTSSVSLNSQKITNLATPTSNADASTKLYVDTKINDLIAGAPSTLDTLDEIAAALADTANFSDTVVLKSGSTMTGALTLSGAPSSNLHAATKAYVDAVAGSATAAQAAQAAAEAAYDSFDDRYLGPKSSAPTLDNDGNALLTGALYFNTVANKMYVYNGTTWQEQVGTVSITRWKKTAAGGETSLSGNDDNSVSLAYTAGYEKVFLNGVLLVRGDDYTATNGTSITGLTALTASDVVEVFAYSQFQVSNALLATTFDAKGDLLVGSANDTVGRLASGVDGYVLTADSAQTLGVKWAAAPVTLNGTETLTNKTLTNVIYTQAFVTPSFTSNAYTLVTGDKGNILLASNGSTAGTINIPTNASVGFPTGTQITIAQTGSGQLTIQASSSGTTTINSTGATPTAPKIRAQYGAATCIKTATDTWLVIGDIA